MNTKDSFDKKLEITLDISLPNNLDQKDREEQANLYLSTIIKATHNAIPEGQRKNIKVIDGSGTIHKYHSFDQITEIYKRDGKIKLVYIGKVNELTDYPPSKN